MSKSCLFLLSLTVSLGMARVASAQGLLPGLPDVNAINASGQVGIIVPRSSTIPRTSLDSFDLWGWGVETEFELPVAKGSRWEATLAVGYNQLSLNAKIYQGRQLRGTLRDLPALSLYFGRATPEHLYFGLTIAESELINGRLIRAAEPGVTDQGPIKVSAGTFSAGAAVGYESEHFFVELGYVGRYFPSIAYDLPPMTTFPADLGQRMYAGGLVLRIGGRLGLKPQKSPKTTIPCPGANAEIQTSAELDIKDHSCSGDVLTVHFVKKPPALAPPALAPPALAPPALAPPALAPPVPAPQP